MSQPYSQVSTIAQLSRVIQRLRRENRSGTLNIRHKNDATYEEGQVTFVRGQITQAIAEKRIGTEALRWINSWDNCQYMFVSTEDVSATNVPATPPAVLTGPSAEDLSAQAQLVPHRVRQTEEALSIIEYLKLSRTHRHVFLLIDGQRTVQELERFLKRDQQGVYELLRDLERYGLIQLTPAPQQ